MEIQAVNDRNDNGRRAVRKTLDSYSLEDHARALKAILSVFAKQDIDMVASRLAYPSSGGHRSSLAEDAVQAAMALCSELEAVADSRRRQGDHDTAESFAGQASSIHLFLEMVEKAKPAWEEEAARQASKGFRPAVT